MTFSLWKCILYESIDKRMDSARFAYATKDKHGRITDSVRFAYATKDNHG